MHHRRTHAALARILLSSHADPAAVVVPPRRWTPRGADARRTRCQLVVLITKSTQTMAPRISRCSVKQQSVPNNAFFEPSIQQW